MEKIEPGMKKPGSASVGVLALPENHQIHEYLIQKTLGGGAFGITYLAKDVNLNLPVAIKEYMPVDLSVRDSDLQVKPNSEKSTELFQWGLERFIEEARALANFRHPNIVRVLRYFKSYGTAYIVMEYESGESLKQWMPGHYPIQPRDLLAIVNPLLDGLELIHKGDFLHRDIKPDNIYIRHDGTPVLLDFGAARQVNTGRDLTAIFSPGFAPFEQYHSHGNQGPWTDIYSLAAVMYWMIGGEKPTEAAARYKNHAMIPAVDIDRHKLFATSFLAAIDWALESEESLRPQTIAHFRARLNEALIEPETSVAENDGKNPLNLQTNQYIKFNSSFPNGENGRRNFICSLMFLDIVAYSKCSVDEQFSLKSEFNQIISSKLSHIPQDSRITLDTGDGAAICFMGDPEEVLHAAEEIQGTLLAQQRLQVRMGLHIGPIRVLNDLNNRSNLIGDGINVAQRVMSFADNNRLVVSRAFYDVVSCLTDDAAKRFRHLGEHLDKHERAHDLYEVISGIEELEPADKTIVLNPHEPAVLAPIDAKDIEMVETELCRLIGPLASVLVKKASARASSLEDLREIISQSITDPILKQSFISTSGRPSDSRVSRSRGEASPSSRSKGDTTVKDVQSETNLSSPDRNAIGEDKIARLEQLFVQTIGPVGRILMKKEMRKTGDYVHLCERLALHIDNRELRASFVKKVSF